MSQIFDQFNKSAKDGSFQEWLKSNPDGNPNTSEVNHAWQLSYKTGWWIFKKTFEVGVFATHDQALEKVRELYKECVPREFYLKRI
jgi:hypothetical protein